ncbi:MAG TPA: hypothetical protein PKY59_15465 [Pyrinomonadaceae bacterium]|nr:hypothetical protein [Pyrinomonadaceae bacterium]
MKKFSLIFSFFLFSLSFFVVNTVAQHCPFDGSRMIVVELTDAKNNPITDAFDKLTLQEIDNPQADSCTYSEGLIAKTLSRAMNAFSDLYGIKNSPEILQKYCADCSFLIDGFYAVKLNQSENSCMIKKDNDFNYKQRTFEIIYENGETKKSVKVSKDDIYSLCTGNGKWSRIVPIKIKAE